MKKHILYITIAFCITTLNAQTISPFIDTEEYGLSGLSIDENFLYVVSGADSAHRKDLFSSDSNYETFDLGFNGSGYYGFADICKVENFLYITKPFNGSYGIYRLNLNEDNPILEYFITVDNAFGLAKRDSELYVSASDKIYKIDLNSGDPSLIQIASGINPIGFGNGAMGLKVYGDFLFISETSGISKINLDDPNYVLESISTFTAWGFAKSDDNTFYLTFNEDYTEPFGAIYELDIETQTYSLLVTIDDFIQAYDIEFSNNSLFVTTLEGASYKVVRVDLNPLSTDDFNRSKNLMYPNPASDFIILTGINQNEKLEIINPSGQIIKSIINKGNSIDISDLKTGVYFIKTKNAYRRFVKK